jgi:hypothetical protein
MLYVSFELDLIRLTKRRFIMGKSFFDLEAIILWPMQEE